jgi:hypothetical protein
LSRAKLGLAILAELPAYTDQATDVHGEPSVDKTAEEDRLQKELEAAVIMRDALKRDKEPFQADTATGKSLKDRFRPNLKLSPKRRQVALAVALGLVAIMSAVYHLGGSGDWLAGKPPFVVEEFQGTVPLKDAVPAGGAFLGKAEPGWEYEAQETVRVHIEQLWADVQSRGFDSMILMSYSGDRPLAQANAKGLLILPLTPAAGGGDGPTVPLGESTPQGGQGTP